jgi:hypothetical protein
MKNKPESREIKPGSREIDVGGEATSPVLEAVSWPRGLLNAKKWRPNKPRRQKRARQKKKRA